MYYFYIIQSSSNINYFYKGSTPNLERRLQEHNSGKVTSTKPYAPFRLVYYEAFTKERTARRREASVKRSGSISTPLLQRIKEDLADA